MIIRPIAYADLDALHQIAGESGPGFTSLAADRDVLAAKIERSVTSFQRPVASPGEESYLFVLEDPRTGDIMGTTGIQARVGLIRPLYHYHCSQVVHHSPGPGLPEKVDVLDLCNHYSGCSEICTLFLRPQYHRPNAGKLLSRVRFLFMAQHPERFASTVIAEMRGISSEQGQSPFWNWFREHIVDLDFDTVTGLVGAGGNAFIAELMPGHPLYSQRLSEDARSVIGRVHPQTEPALALLNKEGFCYRGYVDPFDAGPTVEAELQSIRTVADSVSCRVEVAETLAARNGQDSPPHSLLLANTSIRDFRATVTSHTTYRPADNTLLVPASLAVTLGLRTGGSARFTELTSTASARPGTASKSANKIASKSASPSANDSQNRPAKEPQYAYR